MGKFFEPLVTCCLSRKMFYPFLMSGKIILNSPPPPPASIFLQKKGPGIKNFPGLPNVSDMPCLESSYMRIGYMRITWILEIHACSNPSPMIFKYGIIAKYYTSNSNCTMKKQHLYHVIM
jgi:hypothetical protein